MSFGFSTGEIVNLSQLALKIISNCRKAGTEYDELARETKNLHIVISRLRNEAETPCSLLNRADDLVKDELRATITDCGRVLQILRNFLSKHNGMSEEPGMAKRFWKKVRFGNGDMLDLGDLRSKIEIYASAITLQLNLISMGSQGRVEKEMTSQGSELRAMRKSLNWITASLSTGHEGSILTDYSGDDKTVWKQLRRELIVEGFSSSIISKHKLLIVAYVKELGELGVLDETKPVSQIQSTSSEEDLTPKKGMQKEVSYFLPSQQKPEIYLAEPTSSSVNLQHPIWNPKRSGFRCAHCGSSDHMYKMLTCGHSWCKICAVGMAACYMLAVVRPPPISCCVKIIHAVVDNADARQEIIAEWSREDSIKYGIDVQSSYCPRVSCGQIIQGVLAGRSSKNSGQEIVRCQNCHEDMCITCNAAAHPPDQPCVAEHVRENNIIRMGFFHHLVESMERQEFSLLWSRIYRELGVEYTPSPPNVWIPHDR